MALATLDAALARRRAESASHHPTWQMRMYAAHAATASGWVDLLRLLAADKHPNVAAIAIPGLSAAAGHAGDELYLNVLASNDGQLLMAAAAALTGGAQPVEQLLAALERVTALERETSRAPRRALLARQGYFDGLTFHRVVPNFVIQGGSPGANEFAGDGPYTRDEITDRSHLRGTVGISTRGRDTGDAQIFVNLIDNVRLDFDYTIFAEVIEGMDTVEAVLEGALIDTVLIEGTR